MSPLFDSTVPAGAYDALMERVLPAAREQHRWEQGDGALPAIFLSHGAPPVLDDAQWLDDLYAWGSSLPKPRGIVVVSAHWEDAPAAVSAPTATTPLYYDFWGFHPRYSTLTYATPDATALGRRIVDLLGGPTQVTEFPERGLDHGAFIPLMAMFPAADVPVVQVSMPGLDPQALFRLGEKLRGLREEGILVIGSGFMTHSFAAMRQPELGTHTAAFDAWAADALARGDVDTLADFQRKGPSAALAHPTVEHYVPLLMTLGAATDPASVRTVIDRTWFANSIRSLEVA